MFGKVHSILITIVVLTFVVMLTGGNFGARKHTVETTNQRTGDVKRSSGYRELQTKQTGELKKSGY